jgi:hypothetical protein
MNRLAFCSRCAHHSGPLHKPLRRSVARRNQDTLLRRPLIEPVRRWRDHDLPPTGLRAGALGFGQPRQRANFEFTAITAVIPVKYKDFGAFEGELITRAWPPVAGLASQYGHGFDRPPPLRGRLGDLAKTLLPSVLRPPLYGLRQRRRNASLPPLLGADYVESVLPKGVQWMRSLFRQERMTDPLQISRLLTAEYLARWLGSRTRADWLEISP